MTMMELIDVEREADQAFQAGIHGVDLDGGAAGSGVIGGDDPTQGKGSSAWQEAQRMAFETNAKRRRN